MPQVITGYEPTGSGWQLISERVYAKAPPGTRVRAESQGARVVSVAGFDLWGVLTMDAVVSKINSAGAKVYYISLWRNPPGFLGFGFDDYQACVLRSP